MNRHAKAALTAYAASASPRWAIPLFVLPWLFALLYWIVLEPKR